MDRKINSKEESNAERKEKKQRGNFLARTLKKKTKVNEIPVLFLRDTGKAEIIRVSPINGIYTIEGKNYHERFGSDWEFHDGMKRTKMKIIPQWGMYPLGNNDYLKELHADAAGVQYDMIKSVQTAETVRMSEEKAKTKINPKVAVLIILLLIVVGYFIFQ